MTRRAGSAGFTLIELVITVAIVGLLATTAMPLTELALRRGKEQDLRLALRQIRDAIDDYKAASDEGKILLESGASGYPPDLHTLVAGVKDARDPDGRMIYFLRRVPADPFAPIRPVDPESSWGLRSYESPADAPAAGPDVFDIYSRAAGIGINGVPYREW